MRSKIKAIFICFALLFVACNANALTDHDFITNMSKFFEGSYYVKIRYCRLIKIENGEAEIISFLPLKVYIKTIDTKKDGSVYFGYSSKQFNPKNYKDGFYYQIVEVKTVEVYKNGKFLKSKSFSMKEGKLHFVRKLE